MIVKCQCCGYEYEDKDNLGCYSICPKCSWEDDLNVDKYPEIKSRVNGNFTKYEYYNKIKRATI